MDDAVLAVERSDDRAPVERRLLYCAYYIVQSAAVVAVAAVVVEDNCCYGRLVEADHHSKFRLRESPSFAVHEHEDAHAETQWVPARCF